jgi:hypothetical protein
LIAPRSRRRRPRDQKAETSLDGKAGYLVTLPHGVLGRLKTMRGPGESYSDVIIRALRGTDGRPVSRFRRLLRRATAPARSCHGALAYPSPSWSA